MPLSLARLSSQRWLGAVAAWLVVLVAVGLPRIAVLGDFPSTDEGVFAYSAQIMYQALSHGQGLPDTGSLMLYPMSVSWVFGLTSNPIITLRFLDLVVSLIAGVFFYHVLKTEARSRSAALVLTFLIMFTMNQPVFIQSGFKNSMFAAYIPLFAAMLWSQRTKLALGSWFGIGSLLALAVLLRETFLPFLLVAALAVLVAKGWRQVFALGGGATVTVMLVLGTVLLARGGVHAFVGAYVDAGDFYGSTGDQVSALFVSNGMLAMSQAVWVVAISAVAAIVLAILIARNRDYALGMRLTFWLLVMAVSLFEPLTKIGFPYHFAVALLGLAGLCALAWRELFQAQKSVLQATVAGVLMLASIPALSGKFEFLVHYWGATRDNALNMANREWRPEAVERSNYLLAAEAIRKAAPVHGTLSISGFMFSLFPLTGLTPSRYDLSHLNMLAIKSHFDEMVVRDALEACPPDVLMTSSRSEIPGSETVMKAVSGSTLYTEVATIPASTDKSYGAFGGTVYKRTGGAASRCVHPVAWE